MMVNVLHVCCFSALFVPLLFFPLQPSAGGSTHASLLLLKASSCSKGVFPATLACLGVRLQVSVMNLSAAEAF